MDASPDVLAETVRAKRIAVDNDLELLRLRLRRADPRTMQVPPWATTVLPITVGSVAAVWIWTRRRRAVRSLQHLLEHTTNELYGSELELLPALDRLRARATHPDLQSAFETHRLETEAHVDRLRRVFRSIGAAPSRRNKGHGLRRLLADDGRLLKRRASPEVRDAWLIASAQRIAHVQIATYGTARTYADTLGYTYAAELLQQTLDEERNADRRLTQLAERFVNPGSIRAPHPA